MVSVFYSNKQKCMTRLWVLINVANKNNSFFSYFAVLTFYVLTSSLISPRTLCFLFSKIVHNYYTTLTNNISL